MTDEKLHSILSGIELSECTPIIDNHVYYIEKLISDEVSCSGGGTRIKQELLEFLIIANNGIKKGIILRFGHDDLHWYVFRKWRQNHVLSNALRTGVIHKVWPENKTVTCCYNWDDDREQKYNMTKHLATIAGLSMKDEPTALITFEE